MDARKCDRCGAVYTGFRFMLRKVFDRSAIGRFDIYTDWEITNKTYDLCPACRKELEEWLKGKKKEAKQ